MATRANPVKIGAFVVLALAAAAFAVGLPLAFAIKHRWLKL